MLHHVVESQLVAICQLAVVFPQPSGLFSQLAALAPPPNLLVTGRTARQNKQIPDRPMSIGPFDRRNHEDRRAAAVPMTYL